MGRNDLERCGTVAGVVRDSARAYFGLDGIVEALGNLPEIVRDRALDEVVSGMIDRIDAAPHDPLLSDQMKHSAMTYLTEAGLEFRAGAKQRAKGSLHPPAWHGG